MSNEAPVSFNPVERDTAELELLMAEFNEMTGQKTDAASQAPNGGAMDAAGSEPQTTIEPEPQPNDDSFEQKWKSLQGIVKAKDTQITDLSAQVGQLLAQNQQIMQQLQNQSQSAPAQDANTQDASAENLLTIADSITDQFGAELGAVFTKFAKHIERLESSGKDTNSKLNEVSSTISASKAEVRLSELCPTWRQVDADQGFIAWLQKPAPYSDKPMLTVLNENWGGGNIDTVARIFNEYITSTQTATSQSTAVDPRLSLVTPGSSGGSSTQKPVGNQGKIYTEAEITVMTKELQSGKYRHDPAKATAIDNEIAMAYLENRVR